MALIDRKTLINEISPPLDHLLSTQLIDEFISAERRFIQRDWEPAELDGGQFCEIGARVIYHADSGNLSHSKCFDDCLKYIDNEQVSHALQPRHNAIHLAKVLRTVYKFRSQRGAVHISPNYKPNHMDARFVIESIRWVLNEILRIFWNGDRDLVATAIRELLQFDVPCIGKFDGEILVQRTDLTAEEEIIIILHYAGEAGFSRNEIGKIAHLAPSTITNCLTRLSSSSMRQIIRTGKGVYRLTDLGSKRIRESLSAKLTI